MVLEDLFGARKMFNLALSSYVPVLAFFFYLQTGVWVLSLPWVFVLQESSIFA